MRLIGLKVQRTVRCSPWALLALLSACAGVPTSIVSSRLVAPPPKPADIPKPSSTFALELINRRSASGIELSAFNTGEVHTRGEAVSSLKSWHSKVRLDAAAFLIRHPTQGLVLFDTGLSSSTPRSESLLADLVDPGALRHTAAEGQDIASQLKAQGAEPSAVRWVILSHTHPDHAGMLGAFEEARVVVSRPERERAARGGPDWPALGSRLRLVDLDDKPPFGPFVHAEDFFGDGSVYLVALPGHTAGNMGALVVLDGGPVLLCGDAALVVDNYLDLALPLRPQMEDVEQFWRSLHLMRALAEAAPHLAILPSHDLSALRLSRRADIRVIGFEARPRGAIPRR